MDYIFVRNLPCIAKDKLQEFKDIIQLVQECEDDEKLPEDLSCDVIEFITGIDHVSDSGYIHMDQTRFSSDCESMFDEYVAVFLRPFVDSKDHIELLSFMSDEDAVFGYFYAGEMMYTDSQIKMNRDAAKHIMRLLDIDTMNNTPVYAFQSGMQFAFRL